MWASQKKNFRPRYHCGSLLHALDVICDDDEIQFSSIGESRAPRNFHLLFLAHHCSPFRCGELLRNRSPTGDLSYLSHKNKIPSSYRIYNRFSLFFYFCSLINKRSSTILEAIKYDQCRQVTICRVFKSCLRSPRNTELKFLVRSSGVLLRCKPYLELFVTVVPRLPRRSLFSPIASLSRVFRPSRNRV